MSVHAAGDPGNSGSPQNAWTAEVRRQALIALRIAAMNRLSGGHALGYYVRAAIAHGLTADEVQQASGLTVDVVTELAGPEAA